MSNPLGMCYECGVRVDDSNQGHWSPYFCTRCDEERMARVSRQFEEIAAHFGITGDEDSAEEGGERGQE